MYYEKTYAVDSRDLDCFGVCRPSALLGYLQETAGLAAAAFGASGDEMAKKHNCCWMVVRARYSLDSPLRWRDALTVKTWHRGGEKPLIYRDFDLMINGRRAGQALSLWVLMDLASHAMLRPSSLPEFQGTDGGALIRRDTLPKLRLPQSLEFVEERTLHYSDTDPNGHVNNTRYADLLCDALRLHESPRGVFPRQLQVGYLQECRPGETLSLLAAREGERRYVLGRDAGGAPRFQGCAVLEGFS